MEFSEVKAGDILRVTVAAHMVCKHGFAGPMIEKPAATRTVRVDSITGVNGQPGRKQAWCSVLITETGEDLRQISVESMRPSWSFFEPNPAPLPAITIERA